MTSGTLPAKLPSRLASNRRAALFIATTPWLALTSLLVVKSWSEREASLGFAYIGLLVTYLHINLGYLRSHGNPRIFRQFRIRLVVVPLALLLSLAASPFLLGVAAIVAIHWDAYHTAMQTFGLSRLYEAEAGLPPAIGRRLDLFACLALECLPFFWLLTKLPLPELTRQLASETGWQASPSQLHLLAQLCPLLRTVMVSIVAGGLLLYGLFYWRQSLQGYRFPRAKLILLSGTAISGLVIATHFSLLDYAIVGNLYHALQYLALLALSEGADQPPVAASDGQRPNQPGRVFGTATCWLSFALALAVLRTHSEAAWPALTAFWLSSSLVHFWSDGFIWSRRGAA